MGQRARSAGSWLVGKPWIFILTAIVIAVGVWAKGTRTQPHQVTAVFDEAVSLYKGLDVRVDGLDAGKIASVENIDGKAIVKLGIDDDQIWPLHQGTTAKIRFGSTIGNGTRIIDIAPGPKTAPEIPDNGTLQNADTIEAVEFDQIFDTFDKKTRTALQGTLKGTGDTFGPRGRELRAGVETTPAGLESLAGLSDDLVRDEPALKALVANTHRVTRTLAARRGDLSSLVGVSAATFDEFARRTEGITGSLDRFPPTVREARSTLVRLDTSLDRLDGLVTDLDPGAKQLSALAKDLRPALADLRQTVPSAVATLRTARRVSPSITALLKEAQPFSDLASPVFARLAPMMGCLRPYAPELGALLTQWTSWGKGYDEVAHFGRIFAVEGPTSVTDTQGVSPAALVAATGSGYAIARPPGFNAGKPQFNDACGVGRDGLDPNKDPEVTK